MESYRQVTATEANAYSLMKGDLNFGGTGVSDSNLLGYIKVKAINSFNPANIVMGVPAS